MTDNHHFAVYNTFDFCKLDVLRPIKSPYELKYLSVKSYLKFNQYCFVLENGGLYVRFKNEAIVVSEEVMHVYDDGEKISCLEIDEKNGILFTGCRSGKVRGHIWPIKDNDTFENYS